MSDSFTAKTRPFSELTKDWPLHRRLRVRRRGWAVAKWLNSELDRGLSESSDKLTQTVPVSKDSRNTPT